MVQVFKGAQYIKILLRYQDNFWLTKQMPSQNYYDDDMLKVLETNQIEPKEVRLLTYDMIRNPKISALNAVAVFLVDVDKELKQTNLPLDTHSESINEYKKLINNDMSTCEVFACEGSIVKLVKN